MALKKMAPHQGRPYHVSEEQCKYPTEAKHSENSVANPQSSGIVEFLHFMGLQLKRPQLNCESSENSCANSNNVRVPNGISLRECNVVIFGSTCDICGKTFKCVTDVKIHKFWRHRSQVHDAAVKKRSNICKACGASFKTSSGMKSHWRIAHARRKSSKLIVILRIGEEIVAKRQLKRSHFRGCSVEAGTQTESEEGYASSVGKDTNNVVIDSAPASDNIRTCPITTACTVDTANQYFNDDFPLAKRTKHDESNSQTENQIEESLKASDLAILLSLYRKSAAPKRIDFSNIPSSTLQPEDNPSTKRQEILPADQIVTKEPSAASLDAPQTQISRTESPDAACNERTAHEDDDVQEVLRINRGFAAKDETEINHESPNRCEREMLLSDAIKQMIQIEKEMQNAIQQRRERKRRKILGAITNNGILDERSHNVANIMEPEEMNTLVKQVLPESEMVAIPLPGPEGWEDENMCIENLKVPLEKLNQYGINYYNDTVEINNNN